jgi:AcrR family transcriptional regulator
MNVHSNASPGANPSALVVEEEPRQMTERLQDKKAAVFAGALALIAEQGFTGAPMSQIAERADVGVGTIYRYFAGKEDLINALYLDIKTRLAAHVLRGYSDRMPVRDAFRLLLGNTVRYLSDHPAEMSFTEQYENSPVITDATRRDFSRMAGPIRELFERAGEQNLLRELPFEVLLAIVRGAILSLVKLQLSGAARLDDATLDAALDAIWAVVER